MPRARVVVSSVVERTPRVVQAEGIFAVAPSQRVELAWDVVLPLDERVWCVGLIVGPSGSGKTTIARALWPEQRGQRYEWSEIRSVLDGFPAGMGIKDITALLSSVGFSSPPSWVRPFGVLSTGEQFRVTLARVLADAADIAVVDEFTSTVDRTVAQIGSAALARTVRQRGQQFVAVTCHEDVEDWLQPDWVYRPAVNEFAWRSVQPRPAITLGLCRTTAAAWRVFGVHHYLDQALNKAARCVVAYWHERPVAFVAALGFPHAVRPGWRLHRLVCLPDYQGVGIGNAVADYVSSALAADGRPVFRVAAHPSVAAHCARSPVWRMSRAPSLGTRVASRTKQSFNATAALTRLTSSFEYVGPRLLVSDAARLWHGTPRRVEAGA